MEMMVVSTDTITMISIFVLPPAVRLVLEEVDVWMPMEWLSLVMILLPLTVASLEKPSLHDQQVEEDRGL